MAKVTGTKLITNEVRFSYEHVMEPYQFDNQPEPQYQLCVLIPKSDTEGVKAVKEAIQNAINEGLEKKWSGKMPPNTWNPLRDGDAEHPEDDAFAGHYYLNAKSKQKPGVVDASRMPITDPTQIYSGCYGRVSVSFFPFKASGNNGIGVGLQNVQKLRDGDSLTGRASAQADFDDDVSASTTGDDFFA